MIALIIKALSDSLLQSLFGFIQAELRDRGLVQQGRMQQHVDDLKATVEEAKNAAQIQEDVAHASVADMDAALERVRNGKPASGDH